MLRRPAAVLVLLLLAYGRLGGQASPGGASDDGSRRAVAYAGPVIDVHLHTDPPSSDIGVPNPVTGLKPPSSRVALRDAIIRECKRHNVTRAILNGYPGTLSAWVDADSERFILAPMILKDKANPTLDY